MPHLLPALALGLSLLAQALVLPPGAVVLPGAQAKALLHQCSRDTPAPGEATWQPTAADIVALEAALPIAIAKQPPVTRPRFGEAPNAFGRQYVGIVRGGKRFIYGNFFPILPERHISPDAGPVEVCDGGPSFFGVEYDVESRHITHLAFNGMA